SSSLDVFNTLNWARSGLVEMDLHRNTIITEYTQKTPVPFEVLREGPGYRHVRFLARDVPPMGFKCYAMQEQREGKKSAQEQANGNSGGVLENAYYRIEADAATGALKNIFDKELNRELVDAASPYRFNQYVYVEGGGGNAGSQIVY